MAARYWVGGTGTWNTTNTTNWSTTSGGAGGASVPALTDTVFFNDNSGTGVVSISGATSTGVITLDTANIELSLQSLFSTSGNIDVFSGVFTTNSYSLVISAGGLRSTGLLSRTINLGNSLVQIQGATAINFSGENLIFNAGTSTVDCSSSTASVQTSGLSAGGVTFYNLSLTNNNKSACSITGSNTYNNLTISQRLTAGLAVIRFLADSTQIVNGIFTVGSNNAVNRTFICSNNIGVPFTLNCSSLSSLSNIDFRDTTLIAPSLPRSGTLLGDCGGNSGFTFSSPKTVYWGSTSGGNWGSASWSTTIGGATSSNNFPLAQDTAVFSSTYPSSALTITVNGAYNIGTVDMSARGVNNLTFTVNIPGVTVYGNWIYGLGVTPSGSSRITFSGRQTQEITTAGRSLINPITIDSYDGLVRLNDSLTFSTTTSQIIILTSGGFSANGYNVTFGSSTNTFSSQGTRPRSLNFGSGTWTTPATGTSAWVCTAGINISGTGQLRMTGSNAKTFAGGGNVGYPTLVHAANNALTITGSNKFYEITNSTVSIGSAVYFEGGSTNEFSLFNLNGSASVKLILSSTSTTQAILKKPTDWNVGVNSTDSGNNTGLSFTAGNNNYLNISYINGQLSAAPVTGTGNFLMFFM